MASLFGDGSQSGATGRFSPEEPGMLVINVQLVKKLSWLARAAEVQGERTVRSSGPLIEKKPSPQRQSGRSPSPGGSGCGFPKLSNETSLSSCGAGWMPVLSSPTGVGEANLYSALYHDAYAISKSKKKTYT